MTSDDFMKEIIKRGYSAKYDDVVTVLLDPDTEDPEKLKSIIREEIGWKNSFGIKYTSRPDWMDSPKDARILPENALFRDNQLGNEKIAEKPAPKAPDRESTVPGSVQRKGKIPQSTKVFEDVYKIRYIDAGRLPDKSQPESPGNTGDRSYPRTNVSF